jgi:two-component system cell cycle sensor histidine kinase/response regulator CckA
MDTRGYECRMSKTTGKVYFTDYLKVLLLCLSGLAALAAVSLWYLGIDENIIPALQFVRGTNGEWGICEIAYGYGGQSIPRAVEDDGAGVLQADVATTEGYSSFGIFTRFDAFESTHLRMRWRAIGSCDSVTLSIRNRAFGIKKENCYSATIDRVPKHWTTSVLPLSEFQSEKGSSEARLSILDIRAITEIDFVAPPNTQTRFEIASIEFLGPNQNIPLVTIIAVFSLALFIGWLRLIWISYRKKRQAEFEDDADDNRRDQTFEIKIWNHVSGTDSPRSTFGPKTFHSMNRLQKFLLVVAMLPIVVAIALSIFMSSLRTVHLFSANRKDDAKWLLDNAIIPYHRTEELKLMQDDTGSFLRAVIHKENLYSGFRIDKTIRASSSDRLRVCWRSSGTTPFVQVEMRAFMPKTEIEAVYSTSCKQPGYEWAMIEIPFASFIWNPYANREATNDKHIDYNAICGTAFTFVPGTDLVFDIASLDMIGPNRKWEIVSALIALSICLFGVRQVYRLSHGRKEAEATLQESEARYEAIFNSVHEGILALDPETGKVLDANCTACELFGQSRKDLLDRDSFSTGWMHEAIEKENAEFEWTGETIRGEQIWVEVSLRKAIIGGKPQLLAVIRDVREKKRTEREREELEEKLLHSQKLEAVGRLAGGIAHDFNNLLTGIICSGELARTKLPPQSNVAPALSQILDFAQRASGLTSQLLAFSRQQTMKKSVVRANTLILDMLHLLERVIGEDIHLQYDNCASHDTIRADIGQIEQVIMNMVVNARDAMPQGGKLTISTNNEIVTETKSSGLDLGEYLCIKVTDTGHGLSALVKTRIFEPFFTTKDVGKGTGLGLSMAYGIVRQHHGNIFVDSVEGQGTTFNIFLPVATEEPEIVSLPEPEKPLSGSETIFVVEDNEGVRTLVVEVLQTLGYKVYWADCPASAKQKFPHHANEVDLLLSDVVMPGESGPELYRHLKMDYPDLKVIFMSGYTERVPIDEDLFDDTYPFLQKPFRPTDLGRKIREVLDAAQTRIASE